MKPHSRAATLSNEDRSFPQREIRAYIVFAFENLIRVLPQGYADNNPGKHCGFALKRPFGIILEITVIVTPEHIHVDIFLFLYFISRKI